MVVEIQEKFLAGGAVHDSVGYTAMRDAAALAVNSIVEDILIAATDFQVQFSRPVAKGQLVAHARVMGVSGEHYLAEAVLADADGTEVARGNGAFLPTETALSPEIGYE